MFLLVFILPCMNVVAERRRRRSSSPHVSLCRSQAGLDRIAAALTGAKATCKLDIFGEAPWVGWAWGYGLPPRTANFEEHGLSPLSQPWSHAPQSAVQEEAPLVPAGQALQLTARQLALRTKPNGYFARRRSLLAAPVSPGTAMHPASKAFPGQPRRVLS